MAPHHIALYTAACRAILPRFDTLYEHAPFWPHKACLARARAHTRIPTYAAAKLYGALDAARRQRQPQQLQGAAQHALVALPRGQRQVWRAHSGQRTAHGGIPTKRWRARGEGGGGRTFNVTNP